MQKLFGEIKRRHGKGRLPIKWHSKEKSLIITEILEISDNRDCNYYYKANTNLLQGCVSQENFKYEEKELI